LIPNISEDEKIRKNCEGSGKLFSDDIAFDGYSFGGCMPSFKI